MRPILLLLALGLIAGCDRQKPQAPQGEEAVAPAMVEKGVDRSQKGKPAPDTMFKDPDGGDVSLADFKGVPVLVNLWATWCAPCVKELPTLDRLTELHEHEGDLAVVTVSQDIGPQHSVIAFLTQLKLTRISGFHDPAMGLSAALGVQVMPTTVLYDSQGREVWRYIGDLDWTSAEADRLLSEAK